MAEGDPLLPRDPLAPGNTPFPTTEDVEFARRAGAFYATPGEREAMNQGGRLIGDFERQRLPGTTLRGAAAYRDEFVPLGGYQLSTQGQTLPKVAEQNARWVDFANQPAIKYMLDDAYAKAQLATNRNAFATLGYDPGHLSMDVVMRNANIAGMMSPVDPGDPMYANMTGNFAATLVHEAMHRGMQKLKESKPVEYYNLRRKFDLIDDESVVRYLMATQMGDVEVLQDTPGEAGMRQITHAKSWFGARPGAQKALADLEALAAQYIAEKRPGGPR